MLYGVACGIVVGVHLHSRFCCPALHCSSAVRFDDACSKRELSDFLLVEHEAVVIAIAVLYLLIVSIDVLSDRLLCAEVERCALDFENLSGRDGCLVGREIEISVHLTEEVINCRCRVSDTGKGEESVVREIDDCLLVCSSHVIQYQLIVVCPCVLDSDAHLSCESLVSVWRIEFEDKSLFVHLYGVPHLCMVAGRSAVESVWSVVYGKLVILAVECETAFADAVAKASDEC